MAATAGKHPEIATEEVHEAARIGILYSRTIIKIEINETLKHIYRSLIFKRS